MALQTNTITANGSTGHHKFTLTVNEDSTNISNNTSSVSWNFKISPIGKWDWSYANNVPVTYTVTINGTKYTGNIMSYNGTSTVTIKSGTNSVGHNADGSKSISFSFSVSSNYSYDFLPGSASKSGTMTLTNIPRAASILTAPNFSDGDNPTITYSNPAGNVATSLKACISLTGSTDDIEYRDIPKTGSSYTFNLTEAERNVLRNATTGNSRTVYFCIWTVVGGNDFRVSLPRTFTVSDAAPTISASVVDTNATTIALTGNSSKLIKYYSNAKATMSVEAQKGASIDGDFNIIRNGDDRGYGTTYTFEKVESNVFNFSAKDSRGNYGSAIVTPEMVDYVKLTCSLSNNRPDADGDMTVACSGNYFDGSFGAVDNSLTVQYRYKVYGGTFGNWTDMSVTTNGNSYYASASITGLDYQSTYSFEARAIDKLTEITSKESSVKSVPVFHWGENDFVFEVPVTFKGTGEQVFSSDLRLKDNANYGKYLRFGDGDYCYIAELTDDVMTIKANRINLVANGVYVDDYAIPILQKGVWTPALNVTPSSYTTRYGWYSKMGQTVTIGFFIKATCYSGYHTTNISISGVPFNPMFSAAGGGMCSGVYINAGFNFQCFVVETNNRITTRVQACNNTSSTNLSTSASGCFYRYDGGEITLSGTITYIANS